MKNRTLKILNSKDTPIEIPFVIKEVNREISIALFMGEEKNIRKWFVYSFQGPPAEEVFHLDQYLDRTLRWDFYMERIGEERTSYFTITDMWSGSRLL